MTTDPRTVIRDKVAMALCDADEIVGSQPWAECSELVRDTYRLQAGIAIAAHLEALEQAARIDTVEQLDALPEFSIVGLRMEDGHLYAIEKDEGWIGVGNPFEVQRHEIVGALAEWGSARVLYRPEEEVARDGR